MLTNSTTLKQKIDSLWLKFFAGGIANPLTAIEQMSYLIFLKRLEDIDNSNEAMAKEEVKNINLSIMVIKNAAGLIGHICQVIKCLSMFVMLSLNF